MRVEQSDPDASANFEHERQKTLSHHMRSAHASGRAPIWLNTGVETLGAPPLVLESGKALASAEKGVFKYSQDAPDALQNVALLAGGIATAVAIVICIKWYDLRN
jgi:hypothetical protein